jgi:hypothetical protein
LGEDDDHFLDFEVPWVQTGNQISLVTRKTIVATAKDCHISFAHKVAGKGWQIGWWLQFLTKKNEDIDKSYKSLINPLVNHGSSSFSPWKML